MWLIPLLTVRSMGIGSIMVGPQNKKKTMIQRRIGLAQMKTKSHYLNLETCTWSSKSQASQTE